MARSVSVFGLGYVGSVTAACLAHKGSRVLGVDVNPAKVEILDSGRSPILEPGLREIGETLRKKEAFHWVVLRSTVLPGTTESVAVPALEKASGKKAGHDFAVCFVPEFLREGSAVNDFFEPPFTILGGADSAQLAAL